MIVKVNSELRLELLDTRHLNSLYQLASKNLNHLSTWLDWTSRCTSPAFMEQFIKQCQLDFTKGTSVPFVIIYRDEMAGRIGLNAIQEKHAEIGYWLGKDFQKKGIALASAKSLLHFAFSQLQMQQLNLFCASDNEASKNLAQKLGFQLIKLIPNGEQVNGIYHDLLHFELKATYLLPKTDFN